MGWKESSVMEERMKFVMERKLGELSLAALCRKYEISRPVGYKWLGRYQEEGVEGLQDRSPAAKHHPNGVGVQIEQRIVQLRRQHRYWGPRKLRAWLRRRHPHIACPAVSTMGEIVKRHGLTVPRKRRRRVPASQRALSRSEAPNAVWRVDLRDGFAVARDAAATL